MSQVPLPFPGDPKKALELCASHRFIGVGIYALHVAIHVHLKTGKYSEQAHAIERHMLNKLILKREKSSSET